ncbi:hypothetical protein AOLI_G00003770 [Acnodon oligacanthus]
MSRTSPQSSLGSRKIMCSRSWVDGHGFICFDNEFRGEDGTVETREMRRNFVSAWRAEGAAAFCSAVSSIVCLSPYRWIGVSFINPRRSLHTGQSEGAPGPREGRDFVFKSCAAALARKPRLACGCVLVVLLD